MVLGGMEGGEHGGGKLIGGEGEALAPLFAVGLGGIDDQDIADDVDAGGVDVERLAEEVGAVVGVGDEQWGATKRGAFDTTVETDGAGVHLSPDAAAGAGEAPGESADEVGDHIE